MKDPIYSSDALSNYFRTLTIRVQINMGYYVLPHGRVDLLVRFVISEERLESLQFRHLDFQFGNIDIRPDVVEVLVVSGYSEPMGL